MDYVPCGLPGLLISEFYGKVELSVVNNNKIIIIITFENKPHRAPKSRAKLFKRQIEKDKVLTIIAALLAHCLVHMLRGGF